MLLTLIVTLVYAAGRLVELFYSSSCRLRVVALGVEQKEERLHTFFVCVSVYVVVIYGVDGACGIGCYMRVCVCGGGGT